MKKAVTIKGYDAVQLLLVVFAIVVIGVGTVLIAANDGYARDYTDIGPNFSGYNPPDYPTPTLQNTFKYGGFAFPNMPSDYTIVGKDDSYAGTPEVEYITTRSISQVTDDAMRICKAHDFEAFNDQANGAGSTDGFEGVTFNTYGVDCDASNNHWAFGYVNAADMKNYLQGDELTVPTLTPEQQANINNLTFLTVTSDGPPSYIIN